MKKLISVLLAGVCALSFSLTAMANNLNEDLSSDSMNISTEVPATHSITVKTDGNGTVSYKGSAVKNNSDIEVERLSTPTIIIIPNSGYILDKAILSGKDITSEISGGYYTFESIYENKTLEVTFKKDSLATDYEFTVVGTITENNKPSSGVKLVLSNGLMDYVTDKDGKFSFSKVTEGHHSLTAIKDGLISGYVEFDLVRSNTIDNIDVKLNENGTYVITVNKDLNIVEMKFNIKDDGKLEIIDTSATDDKDDIKDYPQVPNTGFDFSKNWWIFGTVILGAVIVLSGTYMRKSTKIK